MRMRLGFRTILVTAVAILALLGIGLGASFMLGGPTKVLASTGHDLKAACRLSGMSRSSFYGHLQKYKIKVNK